MIAVRDLLTAQRRRFICLCDPLLQTRSGKF